MPGGPQEDCLGLCAPGADLRLASQVSGCPKTRTHFLFPNLGPLFLIGRRRSKASERSWPRQAGHFSPQGPPSLVPAVLQPAVVFLLCSRPGALHKGRTYLQLGWSGGLGWPGASQTSGLCTAGTGTGQGSSLPGFPLPAAALALPRDSAACLQGDLLKQCPRPAPGPLSRSKDVKELVVTVQGEPP